MTDTVGVMPRLGYAKNVDTAVARDLKHTVRFVVHSNRQTSYDETAKSKVKPVLTSLVVAECDDQPGIPGGVRLASLKTYK